MFDKSIFLDNLDYMMKRNEIKARDIEEEAGVSKGYISRLKKEGNASIPGVDFVLTVASLVGVSAEIISTIRLSECSENEQYYVNFLDRLIEKTGDKEIFWKKNTVRELKNKLENKKDEEVLFERPRSVGESLIESFVGGYKYKSKFDYGEYSFEDTIGDFYSFKMDSRNVLYMVKVRVKKEEESFEGVELFLLSNHEKVSNICSIIPGRPKKYDSLIYKLYNTVIEIINEGGLDEEAKAAINSFMKKQ